MIGKEQDASTRKVLVNMMKTQGALSVSEMAKQLGITEMAVRRHLNTLERDGFIRSELHRQPMGRPSHVYSLTAAAEDWFPKNYQALTMDLLDELVNDLGNEQVGRLFEGRKDKLIGKYEDQMEGKDLLQKVEQLAEIQNHNGYMVEWDKDQDGNYVFKEFNCPISQVANQFNQACQCELKLFQSLLQTEVDRTECLAKGDSKCVYVIQAKGNEK
jgi:predicted ArsR family transcriptional regulator